MKRKLHLLASICLLTASVNAQTFPPIPIESTDKTMDSDSDGIKDYQDMDDDNDGILDKDEAFSCGIEIANLVVPGSKTIADFEAGNIGDYANVPSGLASVGVLAVYTRVPTMTKIGRIAQGMGTDGKSIKILETQYSHYNGQADSKIGSNIGGSVHHFAFREDKFNLEQPYRKFVIEFDWKGGDDNSKAWFNEWGNYLSNGSTGTIYFDGETAANYSAIISYKSGLSTVINKVPTRVATPRNGFPFTLQRWYRVKTEYMLMSNNSMKISTYMQRYKTDGTLSQNNTSDDDAGDTFAYYFFSTTINIDLSNNHSYLVNGFQAGILSDSNSANVNMYWLECDTDGDDIPNRLDLDSDNDGCTDAIEGSATLTSFNLVDSSMPGGNTGTTSGDYNKPITQNLGITVNNTTGIPNVANSGQGIGSAYDAAKKEATYCACFKDAITSGKSLSTNHGITLLKRAGGEEADAWPMSRKGAWTALESNTKGFVITRMTTNQIDAITNPHEGMMTYDTNENCLKIYNGTSWKCFSAQACPN